MQVSPPIRDFFSWHISQFPLNAQLVLKIVAVAGAREDIDPTIVWGAFPFDTERPLIFNVCEKLRAAGLLSFEPPDIYGSGSIWFRSPFVFKLVLSEVTARQRQWLKEAIEAATPDEDSEEEDEAGGNPEATESAKSAPNGLRHGGPNATNKKLMLECAAKCKDDMATQQLFDSVVAKAHERLKAAAAVPRVRRRSSLGLMFEQSMNFGGDDDDDAAWNAAEAMEERFRARGEEGGRGGKSLMFLDETEIASRVASGDNFAPETLLDMLALYLPWQLVVYLGKQRPNIISDDPFSAAVAFNSAAAAASDDEDSEDDMGEHDQRLPITVAIETACLVVKMRHRVTLSPASYSGRMSRMIRGGTSANATVSDADDGDAAVAQARLKVRLSNCCC